MRNPTKMIEARRRKSQAKKQHVLETIQAMVEQGKEITVSTVAKNANVSRPYIYGCDEIRNAIEQAQQHPLGFNNKALLARCRELEEKLAKAQARTEHLEQKRKLLEIQLKLAVKRRNA